MNIALIGFGELGKQIIALLLAETKPDRQCYFDDIAYGEGRNGALPFSAYMQEEYNDFDFYIGLGYKHLATRVKIADHLLSLDRRLPTYIAPGSFVSHSAILGQGTILYPMCNVDKDVRLGKAVLVNNSVTISHNTVVGDSSYLSPGVTISGFVTIGSKTFVGTGTVIANNVTIGSNVIIGIGSVITRDIPDNTSVIGNPMKILKTRLRLV